MKIAVLSDTHIPVAARTLPGRVLRLVSDADAVVHAGDFQSVELVDFLSGCGEFYGVSGNMDPPEIRELLPEKRVVHAGGVSIGLIHGWGSPEGLQQRVLGAFEGQDLHAVVFGHSHHAANIQSGNVLLFNPGSPTDRRFARRNSVGILTVEEGSIAGEIVTL